MPYHVVLASSSPRRQVLLREAGVDFEVTPPALAEPADAVDDLSPRQQAEALSYFKARAVVQSHRPDDPSDPLPVLAADTVVALGDEVFGKPSDADDARRMLRTLSSHPHQVITGVCIIAGPRRLIASDVTTVSMRAMTDREIEDYVASGEWEGKAGGYAIQETADRFVTDLDGSFSNVVGLPIELVRDMLEEVEPHDAG
ncbi:MAG: Maf family protein [Planctomycetota bacterium]|jgi:septum formation protein